MKTLPEKLQQLESKIIELVPSLQELSFGCEVEVYGIREDNPGCEKDVIVDGRISDGRVTLGYYGEMFIENFIVLGHPILLHHLLQAIYKHRTHYFPIRFGHRSTISIGENPVEAKSLKEWTAWDLTKPLSEQSPETISFLWDLLNK